MPSIVWDRDPQEAFDNPYEYGVQDQFVREAEAVLAWLNGRINPRQRRFGRDERSLDKALWMLAVDAIDALTEALALLREKRHRVAARVFRDSLEVADLMYAMAVDPQCAAKWLGPWYENRSPAHREIRQWMETFLGSAYSGERNRFYQQLSKFTHRSYRALLASYSVGAEELLVHDSWSPSGLLVLPQTIASLYAVLADLILNLIERLVASNALVPDDVVEMWQASLESHTVPRRFQVRAYWPQAP